jgi:putative membrane protein
MTASSLLAALVSATIAVSAAAGTSPGNKAAGMDRASSQRTINRADRELLVDIARSGHAETAASKLALQKSQNPEVKAFAQRVIEDHAKADARLRAVAAAKRVDLPDGPSTAKKAKLKLLEGMNPRTFDGAYLEHFGVVMHEEALETLRGRALDGDDSDVKTLAKELVPVLEGHLNTAHELRGRIDPSAQHSKRP